MKAQSLCRLVLGPLFLASLQACSTPAVDGAAASNRAADQQDVSTGSNIVRRERPAGANGVKQLDKDSIDLKTMLPTRSGAGT